MSEINYYTEASGVTVQESSYPVPGQDAWRPGLAGPFERVAAGSGEGDGWFLYFVARYLVLELWRAGDWVLTRHIDCAELLNVTGGQLTHMPALGYSLDDDLISLGCVTVDQQGNKLASVHRNFLIPGLGQVWTHPPELYLGSMPVTVTGGETQWRTLGGEVRGVGGRFMGRDYLSAGELSRIAELLRAEVQRGL